MFKKIINWLRYIIFNLDPTVPLSEIGKYMVIATVGIILIGYLFNIQELFLI